MAEYTINEENGRLILHLKGELVLNAVTELKDEIKSSYDAFNANINAKYNEVEKRQQGGN